MAMPPSSAPTAMATGRLRPVLVPALAGSGVPGVLESLAGPASLAWSAAPWSCCSCSGLAEPDSSCPRRKLDLEKLGFLVLEQLVHLAHVAVRELVEVALGAVAVVLAGLAVLDQLVDRVLGVPADVADRDPAVLRLVPGHLDELPAALLGQLGEHDPDDDSVV